MDYFHVKIYQGSWIGDKHYPYHIGEDTLFALLAADQPAALKVLSVLAGEYASADRHFDGSSIDFDALMKQNFQQDEGDRKRGIMSDIERHLRRLTDKASEDLGSIVIDSALITLSGDTKKLIGARFEAHEGDRRRVVYLDSLKHESFMELAISELVEAIEAKF